MAQSDGFKESISNLYPKLVGECGSSQEHKNDYFGFSSISGYDKEEYETRTTTNLNHIKF